MQQISVNNNVYTRIIGFYYNSMSKYEHTYFPDEADRDIDKVADELYKVGTNEMLATTSALSKWKGYDVCRSKDTGWYYAYKIQNNVVYVYDAENYRNMSDNANINQTQQANQQQKQIQYQPVSNQYFYGLMMVKSSNGLFNFVNKNNQIFHPNQWFNQAYDFKKENNGAICARVEYNKQWYLLALDGKLYTMGNVNGYTNENYRKTIQTILAEQQIGKSLNFMQRLLNYRFW